MREKQNKTGRSLLWTTQHGGWTQGHAYSLPFFLANKDISIDKSSYSSKSANKKDPDIPNDLLTQSASWCWLLAGSSAKDHFFWASQCNQTGFLHLENCLPPLQLGRWARPVRFSMVSEHRSWQSHTPEEGFESEACVAEKQVPSEVHSGENGNR